MPHCNPITLLVLCLVALFAATDLPAQKKKPFIPRRQDKPPGPALSPQQAIKKMKVPPGFSVELVAAEPNIVNPIGMCFDEKGRAWITESLEYPRRRPGKGRDRIKILEDTDGDGKMDKFTVFADGLNIPSGIAVGYGGVWVANSPDLLFLQDTDGDGKADKREVVVTGFGRTDTHELPNSLVWGPDGWLYGLNGVFNYSHVRYAKTNPNYDPKHPGWKFTCALFRIHPRTRKFEVFAEGTSNPWGVAWNDDGEAFLSACVIDHLWHITETGYYHRQGGPYPPHTWKIGSIVNHKHQKAAYCGIHYYDSDAYPKEYRGHLYMGNVHAGCINVDTLRRDGSTYFATPRPDFLTANDAWFMPVAQKTGPDGCLYVLDWYDRYHCYQDANRDPAGIDRLKGRLYRIRYNGKPKSSFAPRKNALSRSERRRWKPFDLSKETDEQLIKRLHGGNGLLRRLSRRILTERNDARTKPKLRRLVVDDAASRIARLNALWALIGTGSFEKKFHLQVMKHKDATFRAWGVRAAGNMRKVSTDVRKRIVGMAKDKSPIVKREVAIASRKVTGIDAVAVLTDVLGHSGKDKLIPHIVWNNLQPLLEKNIGSFITALKHVDFEKNPGASAMLPYVVDRMLAFTNFDPYQIVALAAIVRENAVALSVLSVLTRRVQSREITGKDLQGLKKTMGTFDPTKISRSKNREAFVFQIALLSASWNDPAALKYVAQTLHQTSNPEQRRLQAARALISAQSDTINSAVDLVLSNPKANSPTFRGRLLPELGRLKDDKVADVVLKNYGKLEPELQPKAVELLTQRVNWSRKLLAAIGKKTVPANAINLNQARRLLAFKNADLTKLVRQHWGIVRMGRDPKRAQYVATWKRFLRKNHGDAFKGEKVFYKVCGQCHKMYGKGSEVGPDITRNGRNSFDQLLSNVFDPSLVIGSGYRAWQVATKKGRVVTGLLVENSPQRIVLKVQGGKLETIARGDVDIAKESKLSMMPEDLEKQLKPHEIADLFAFITLDRHPKDKTARQLPGVREIIPRETSDPKKFGELVAEVLPGFTTQASGVGGVRLLRSFRNRQPTLRTHPVNRTTPCVLSGTFKIPKGKRSRLLLAVSHDRRGDWKLIVKANGSKLFETTVGPKSTTKGWADYSIDLSRFAGKTVKLELHNHPTGWIWEFGYWQRAEVVSD